MPAQASAQHEQACTTGTTGHALTRCRHRGNGATHRIADPFGAGQRIAEACKHALCVLGELAIGETSDAVLFVHEQRPTHHAGGDAAGAGHVAAHRQHAARLDATKRAERRKQCTREHERRQQTRLQSLAAQATDRHGHQIDAMRRHDLGLHATFGTEPHHRHALRAQRFGHGEAREDVATRTAGHDEDWRRHAVTASRAGVAATAVFASGTAFAGMRAAIWRASMARLISYVVRSRTPAIAQVSTMDEPP